MLDCRQTGPDHGPVLLLKASDASDCRSVQTIEKTGYIEVFAFYNALEDMKRLSQILRWECTEVDKGTCGHPPSGLRVTGLHSESAQVNLPDGWVDIVVVTQAGKPDPEFDPSVPSVNYDLSLHTRVEDLAADLRVFRQILRTIRLAPPN